MSKRISKVDEFYGERERVARICLDRQTEKECERMLQEKTTIADTARKLSVPIDIVLKIFNKLQKTPLTATNPNYCFPAAGSMI